VDHSFATAWDGGVMLAARRTWWRIAAQLEDQMLRPKPRSTDEIGRWASVVTEKYPSDREE